MQIVRYNEQLPFFDGGAIHKITGNFKGKVSAYVNANKELVDAEQITGSMIRAVKKDGPIWKHCQQIANRVF